MSHSHLNVSKSGLAIAARQRSSVKVSNYLRSMTTIAREIDSAEMHNSGRLVGGADIPESEIKREKEEAPSVPSAPGLPAPFATSPIPPTPPPSPVEEIARQPLRTSGPCCFCESQTAGSVGDKKIDEIIEHVHQTLEDASKALATLGENFEHDLKLMFVDIMSRIQQWIGTVKNKHDTCKVEINNLRKELLARVCDANAKAREVEDLRAQITDYQNQKNAYTSESEKQAGVSEQRAQLNDAVTTKEAVIKEEKAVKEEDDPKDYRRDEDEKGDRDELLETRRGEERGHEERREKDASVAVQTTKGRELESEIERLRKENDRIMKERAEYENAIQRALLRGVSSLNVEALRVLRCPPIPCCIPCAPCPATTTVPPQPVVPCLTKNAKKRSGSAAATVCATKATHDRNTRNSDQTSSARRPCASPCCIASKSQKPADGSAIFLLHQSDAGSLCVPERDAVTPICGSPIMNNIDIPPLPRFGSS